MTPESKICELSSCGKEFYRNKSDTDFVWKIKRYCNFRCRMKSANGSHARRVETRRKSDGFVWSDVDGEPPEHVVAELKQRAKECRERGLAGLVYAGED